MGQIRIVEHAVVEVLHRADFNFAGPRITRTQKIDVYNGDKLVSQDEHFFWYLPSGKLHHISSRSDTVGA